MILLSSMWLLRCFLGEQYFIGLPLDQLAHCCFCSVKGKMRSRSWKRAHEDSALDGGSMRNSLELGLRAPSGDFAKMASTDPS